MKIAVCTLFERQYHLGAAVLINSLCRGGFTGSIYAGFRGPLPPWAESRARAAGDKRWEMEAAPGVKIVFLALDTTAHFANYKADFLLQLEALAGAETEAVVYSDPDVVFNGEWAFVEEWISCGVTLCEDVNSPHGENHPHRVGWRRFFNPLGFDLRFRAPDYANSGFIGLRWADRRLLVVWQKFMAHLADSLGGMDVVSVEGGRLLKGAYGFANCFYGPDQDSLNAALEACPEIPISFLNREAMGFLGGKALLAHAVGLRKPWVRPYIREAFGGLPPFAVDKAFWHCADGPIQPFSRARLWQGRFQLNVGAALGRFIRRG